MKKNVQKLLLGLLCLILLPMDLVYGSAAANLGIQNDRVIFRVGMEFPLTSDKYQMLLFAKTEWDGEDVWVCIFQEQYGAEDLANEYQGKNGQIQNVPMAGSIALKLFGKDGGRWEESLGLCKSRLNFSDVTYEVQVAGCPDRKDEWAPKEGDQEEFTLELKEKGGEGELYIRMEEDQTILPLDLAQELYDLEADLRQKEGKVVLRCGKELFSEVPVLFSSREKNSSGIFLQECETQSVQGEDAVSQDIEKASEPTRAGRGDFVGETDSAGAPGAAPTAGALRATPAMTPGAVPTAAPTVVPTATPTAAPTVTPTVTPTAVPTATPTATPTVAPTATSAAAPTAAAPPAAVPAVTPTPLAEAEGSPSPTVTEKPGREEGESGAPSLAPTVTPSPALSPAVTPTPEPIQLPLPGEGGEEPQDQHLLFLFQGRDGYGMLLLIMVLLLVWILLWLLDRLWGTGGRKNAGKPASYDEEETVDPRKGETDQKERIRVEAAAANNKGRVRGNNEDNFYLNGSLMPREKMDEGAFLNKGCQEKVQLYAVCDGMGGSDSGEEASYEAVRSLASIRQRQELLENQKELTALLRKISDSIYRAAVQRSQKSGTTIALVLLNDGRVTFVNVGDSRIYRLRRGELRQISLDHSKVQRMISMGILTPEQAKKDPSRHVITQYLGMPPEVKIAPHIVSEEKLLKNDVYLLCSDGLTDMVEDPQIEAILREKERPQDAAAELLRTALLHGGRDNVTVMVLRIQKEAVGKKKPAGKRPAVIGKLLMGAMLLTGGMLLAAAADLIYYLI
ncbi:MAG: protein phosphatase 2C domain-containing protein [Eubacteriales bacterium]|nr:protein phosphatase 2C domain-containing protein [Eubacteriales bacterium]